MRPEFPERRKRLAQQIASRKLDALVVSAQANIRYLCGFTGSNGLLLVRGDGWALLLTDPRYELQAQQEADCLVRITRKPLTRELAAELGRRRLRRVGFEAGRLTYADYESLKAALRARVQLKPVADAVESLRLLKSEAEVEAIGRSMAIAAAAFEKAMRAAREGIREAELAAELDYQMRLLGAEKPAFETIVLFGENAALPHGKPGTRALRPHELVLVDIGAQRDGYASDMTRMAVLGTPSERVRRLYQIVLDAQQAALEQLRPGVTGGMVDAAARKALERHGLDQCFSHSTGHGVGLEVHEAPRLGKDDKTRIQPGMVVTVEPGIYIEGWGGIRIEDTVVVTSNGSRILTPAGKELLRL